MDDGLILGQAGAGCQVDRNNLKVKGTRFQDWEISEASPAASYTEPRLDLMDEVGIWAHIVYPNVVGFGGQNFGMIQDAELRNLCATIYNDGMIEMAEVSGGRLNGMAILPWWDIDRTVSEVERVHKLGLKGINTSSDPQLNFGLPDLADEHWEPLWDVCEDLNMPVNFHIGASQTQSSWFGSDAMAFFRRRAKTRRRFCGPIYVERSHRRKLDLLGHSGTPPETEVCFS